MTPIDDFLPRVLTFAPQCPDTLAYRAIRDAAREACRRGLIWRETDTIAVTTPGEELLITYDQASIVSIQAAEIDGIQLKPIALSDLDEVRPGWQNDTDASGQARWITQMSRNTLTLYPRAKGTIKCRMVLMPSQDAQELPEMLYEQYAKEISEGAAAEILMSPDPAVRNYDLGMALKSEFSDWLDTINVETVRGQMRARRRTRGSFF